MRRIKTAFINFWVRITPTAAKHKIQGDFMRAMVNNPPKLASNLTQPLRTRVDYGATARSMFQIQKMDE